MPTIQELAKEALTYFTTDTRNDSTEFVKTTDDRPEWLYDLVYAAHNNGQILPDDWRYDFICESLSYIVDNLDDPDDEYPEEMEADIYTSELTDWLHSRNGRYGYVDEAVSEYGYPEQGVITALMMGQLAEKHEVYYSVLSSLKERVGDLEEEEDDDGLGE